MIDQLGRTTHYDYDNQGRLVKTTYPDTTFELIGYDLEGRRTSFQDRALRLTTYDYDEIGRLTKTHYPDTSFTETACDTGGRVSDTFDELRNDTKYSYDDADRRVGVVDAAGNPTSFAYDNVGNQTWQHTTTFTYDRLGRRVLTTFHDQTTESQHYDFLGRMDSKTDQAGKVTQFAYDPVGRLTSVTKLCSTAAPGCGPATTSYAYDEVGNRISQTDANSHVTCLLTINSAAASRAPCPWA